MCRGSRILAALALTVLGTAAAPALAAPKAASSHPGFLSSKPFVDLAGPEDELIEINVGREMLASIAKGMGTEEDRRLVEGIVAVHAVVIGLAGDATAPRLDRARHLVQDTTERLLASGWEPLVRLRDKSSTVSVLTRAAGAEGLVQGLAVLVVEEEDSEPQIVFANIAGTLDMRQLRRLSAGLNLPGLDQLED